MTCLLRAGSRRAEAKVATARMNSIDGAIRRGQSSAFCGVFRALGGGLSHYFFDFGGVAGEALA